MAGRRHFAHGHSRMTGGSKAPWFPELQIANASAFWDPARGVVLSGSNVVTVADQVAGGNADTLTGNAGSEPQYVVNSSGYPSFSLNGASCRFTANDSADLSSTAAWTYACWVRRSASGVLTMLQGQYSGVPYRCAVYVNASDVMTFEINNVSLATWTYGTSTAWRHVAWVFDGSQGTPANRVAAYLNGSGQAKTDTGTHPTTMTDVATDFWWGGAQNASVNGWQGELGSGGIWSRALTATEISNIYNNYQKR